MVKCLIDHHIIPRQLDILPSTTKTYQTILTGILERLTQFACLNLYNMKFSLETGLWDSLFIIWFVKMGIQMKKFYQSRKSQRNMVLSVIGDKIPLYGSGASLSTPTGITTLPVPLKLVFTVRSRAYVLGKLVKPKFYRKIECSIVYTSKKLNVPISLKNSCTYH